MHVRQADRCASYRLSPILRRAHATLERMGKERRSEICLQWLRELQTERYSSSQLVILVSEYS